MDTSRIMIVEDEVIIAKDLELKLKRQGFEVPVITSSGEEAVKEASQWKPDLVLMDIKLSGEMDGIQAARMINTQLDVPVIYLTALVDEITLLRAKETGPFGYLLKPIENRELSVSIDMALYKHRLEKKLKYQLQCTNAMRLIDQAILQNHDMQEMFHEVLQVIIGQLDVDAAAILVFNPFSATLQYTSWNGFQTQSHRNVYLRLGESWAGKAAESKQKVIIEDIWPGKDDHVPAWIFLEDARFYLAAPLIMKGQVKGVLEILHRGPHPIDEAWLNFLDILTEQAAIALDNSLLFDDLFSANIELSRAYNATIEGWSSALELRDLETIGHSQRVTAMTQKLASALGIEGKQLEHIRRGALLHDVGKMGIPDHILLNPGSLSDQEWEVMRKHPEYAYNLLSGIPFLKPALDIPYCHHEKWDGSGYPQGISGDQIPLAARIFAIVDVWDAMLSNRPYHAAASEEKVLAYIHSQSGKHFDPTIVGAFLKLRESEIRIEAIKTTREAPEPAG